jgi:hypothetical protein
LRISLCYWRCEGEGVVFSHDCIGEGKEVYSLGLASWRDDELFLGEFNFFNLFFAEYYPGVAFSSLYLS